MGNNEDVIKNLEKKGNELFKSLKESIERKDVSKAKSIYQDIISWKQLNKKLADENNKLKVPISDIMNKKRIAVPQKIFNEAESLMKHHKLA
jgi:hypothetical protein